MKSKIKSPVLLFNPKTYLYGKKLDDLVDFMDSEAEGKRGTYLMTVPLVEIERIASRTKNIILFAQHMDGLVPGRGMGGILAEALSFVGVNGCILNHAEKPLLYSEIEKSVDRAKELGLLTILCGSSYNEIRALAYLKPTIILAEPTDLIGTGSVSDEKYIQRSTEIVKEISPNTLVIQGAGVSSAEDVTNNLKLGSDGSGSTSGITEANDPKKVIKDMIEATERFASS